MGETRESSQAMLPIILSISLKGLMEVTKHLSSK
jgi:hypothetical protein